MASAAKLEHGAVRACRRCRAEKAKREGVDAMDAIQFLKQEHETAKAAFRKIQAAPGRERGQLWNELKPELEVHEQIEEACLYGPLAKDATGKDSVLATWEGRHAEEVRKVKGIIKEIDALTSQDERWLALVKDVQASLEAHIREEEGTIFPRISQVWDRRRLDRAGAELEQKKAEASRRAA
jgi:iron-sulfur cluster repair protein YtfE (RIC family)